MSSDQDALRRRFKEIAVERLRELNQVLLVLEEGETDSGLVDKAMREIHTLKGESRMLGLGALNRVSHRTEDLLLHAKKAGRLQDEGWLQHVFAGFDLLADLLDAEGAPGADEPRAKAFAERAEALLAAEGAKATAAPPAAAPGAQAAPPAPAPATEAQAKSATEEPSPDGGSQRVARITIDEITRTAGEVGILQAHLRQFDDDATRIHHRMRDTLAGAGLDPTLAHSLGEEMGELADVLRAMRDVGFDASIRQHRLQAAVERMRLAAVSTLFDRFPRTVRDLARELGKEARLVTEGGHVGADQQILELLADPLLHLIRNAVDHGLEPPDNREAEGKPRRGTIRLGARQAGRFVEILVRDDGRGIDPAAIADAAVRKGLLSEADIGRMSDGELIEQLFRPAFSTKNTVSDISGRGVGLDVVRAKIEDIGGTIHIESRIGGGTTFFLRLPVSIALVDALVLDLKHALYAIPSAYVERILEVDPSDIEATGGRDVVKLETGGRVPVLDLVTSLGFPPIDPEEGEKVRLVIVAEGTRRVGLRVPGFEGELALVQEGLDPFLKGLRIVTGTAMLDGGRRVVMLNGVQLLELVLEGGDVPGPAPTAPPLAAAPSAPRKALVIEDSDLTRSMLVSELRSAGWAIVEAVNGRVGLELFASEAPDVVLTDLEMPLVGGLEVIRAIRAGDRNANVPIVMLTTVDDEARKQEAAEAGADIYVTKSSFVATEMLEVLDRLLAGRRETES